MLDEHLTKTLEIIKQKLDNNQIEIDEYKSILKEIKGHLDTDWILSPVGSRIQADIERKLLAE